MTGLQTVEAPQWAAVACWMGVVLHGRGGGDELLSAWREAGYPTEPGMPGHPLEVVAAAQRAGLTGVTLVLPRTGDRRRETEQGQRKQQYHATGRPGLMAPCGKSRLDIQADIDDESVFWTPKIGVDPINPVDAGLAAAIGTNLRIGGQSLQE